MYHKDSMEHKGPRLSFRETMEIFIAFLQLLFPRACVLFGAIGLVTILLMLWLR